MDYLLTAPCNFGLEKTLAFEVKRAGGQDIVTRDGRIDFKGDDKVIAKANITCSTAERIGIVLARFRAVTLDEVVENCRRIPIEVFAGREDQLHVLQGHSLNSALSSVHAIQTRIRVGLIGRMQEKYKIGRLPETGTELRIDFLMLKNELTITLDTTGSSLHKRGYRAFSNAAPIKETLAAGIVDIAHIRDTDTVVDPFCGSGTILIEAAMKAAGVAPGLNRKFSAMYWKCMERRVWNEAFEEARAAVKKDCGFEAYGYDIDPEAVKLTQENAKKAGVEKYIKIQTRDIKDFHYPVSGAKIVTNPPYAERMGTSEEVREIYRTMGRVLLPRGDSSLYIITSIEDFEELFGEKANKNRKLYNGMIQCRLYSYYG